MNGTRKYLAVSLACLAGCARTELVNSGRAVGGTKGAAPSSVSQMNLKPSDVVFFDPCANGKSVVFSGPGSGGAGLYLLSLGDLKVTSILDTSDFEFGPSLSWDGGTVAYAAASSFGAAARIFICSLTGGKKQQLTQTHAKDTDNSTYDQFPSFSPDGTKIIFARASLRRDYSMGGTTWDSWDVYMIDRDGSNLVRLTSGSYYQLSPPRFSCSGKEVVFSVAQSEQQTNGEISLTWNVVEITIAGSLPASTRLITHDGRSSWPSFAHSSALRGNEITFLSDRESPYDYEVYISDAKGQVQSRLSSTGAYNASPKFSSDDRQILFLSDKDRDGSYELWQIGRDGTNLKRIADNGLFKEPLQWSP